MGLAYEFQKKKIKFILYGIVGFFIAIILIIAGLTGDLEENCGDDTTSSQVTNLDDKGMEENAKNIAKHWKQKYGATPQAAAGILGVLQLESRLDPKSVNSSSGATGLAQWLGGRKDKLEDLAHKESKPATNLGVQLDYLDQELNSSYYASNKQIFKYTDVHKATKAWLMDYEGMSKNPEQWFLSKRYAFADHWYSVIGTKDPVAGDSLKNASQDEEANANLDCASDTDTGKADGNIIKTAKSMKGYFKYGQSHPSADLGTNLKNPNKSGTTDCSGFIWLTLNKAGYKVPANMGWFTGTMASDAKGSHQYLKQISENDAKAGDIVIVNQGAGAGNNGHTAFITENWHGKNTKIIEEGGDTTGHVNESTFGTAFYSLLSGSDVTLARPIKK
ncbi:phage tail-type lysozyme domain-containing protein [Levilactobacillus brevis]|uniref:CHAP domain-containing protein n=1 Tax=Lactiplantibacillus plantarum TaxID=1590 RepID=A0AAX1KDV5_LACPN|nr:MULTISPECIES: phage tail tip lysozyme [Lactobacillaceae]ATL80175.1 CHAP domain-containing protein [Lactiplantibacillus plantarum]MBP5835461.1 CHAP domain-containing protein [Lactiplantibacillus plantarum]MBT9677856.1 CHAP domain-containing protein [Levilactobacillus brevis]MBU7498378.1 CHAP domain-containing protein [Lactiplantibacillus pentosus]MBU7539950.1 CHAP domain-containing protein [Levilactobacillus brevis]